MSNTKNSAKSRKTPTNPRSKSVMQMTAGGRKLKKYSSIRQAGLTTGVDLAVSLKLPAGFFRVLAVSVGKPFKEFNSLKGPLFKRSFFVYY